MGPLGNVADRHRKTISILQTFWLEIDELRQVFPVILIKVLSNQNKKSPDAALVPAAYLERLCHTEWN